MIFINPDYTNKGIKPLSDLQNQELTETIQPLIPYKATVQLLREN